MTEERGPYRPNIRLYLVVFVLIVIVTIVLASTGPSPTTQSTGTVARMGGVCLQLERWGLFGWDILGQSYSAADLADTTWHSPPVTNPPCEIVEEAEQLVQLPLGAPPDVYRVCGLADERGCLEFELVTG